MAAHSDHIYPGCYGKTDILVGLLCLKITLERGNCYTILLVQVYQTLEKLKNKEKMYKE